MGFANLKVRNPWPDNLSVAMEIHEINDVKAAEKIYCNLCGAA